MSTDCRKKFSRFLHPCAAAIKSHKYNSCQWGCAGHKSPCRHSQKLPAAYSPQCFFGTLRGPRVALTSVWSEQLVPVGLCKAQIPLSALAKTSRGLFPTMFLRHFAESPCCTNFCLERTARAGGFVQSTNPPVGTRKNFLRLFFAFRGCATLSSLPLRLSIKSHKYNSCRWVCAGHKSTYRHSQKLPAAFLCISRLRRIFRRAPPLLRERK